MTYQFVDYLVVIYKSYFTILSHFGLQNFKLQKLHEISPRLIFS